MAKRKTGIGDLGRIAGLGGNAAYPAQGLPAPSPILTAPEVPGSSLKRPSKFPQGPNLLGLGVARKSTGGPGEPPEGFVTGQTSKTEWYFYWACGTYFKSPPEIRKPPFNGDLINWQYQVASTPGDVRSLGSSVDDFVFITGNGIVIVRLDTWYFHITASATQVAKDLQLKQKAARLSARVVTAYDQEFIGDATGRAAVATVHRCVTGREALSPTTSGLAYAIRDKVTGASP